MLGNFVNRAGADPQVLRRFHLPSAKPTERGRPRRAGRLRPLHKSLTSSDATARDALLPALRVGNKYMTEQEPWKAYKTDPERTAVIPIRIRRRQLCGLWSRSSEDRGQVARRIQHRTPAGDAASDMVQAGTTLCELPILFEKVEAEVVDAQLAKLESARAEATGGRAECEPQKEIMTFEDFQKLDLRVGEVIACERVPKADRLLNDHPHRLDERTVLSGIAEHFTPEEVGRRALAGQLGSAQNPWHRKPAWSMAETADGSLRFRRSKKARRPATSSDKLPALPI